MRQLSLPGDGCYVYALPEKAPAGMPPPTGPPKDGEGEVTKGSGDASTSSACWILTDDGRMSSDESELKSRG